jgi:hypothetical protein
MRTLSWIVLTLVAAALILGGLGSAWIAYLAGPDTEEFGPGGPKLSEVQSWRPDIAQAIRARRGTAAAYAAGFGVLFLFTVLGPYRRGDVWSWWTLLVATLLLAVLILLRVPLLGTRLGAGTGGILAGVVVVALLLDVRRLSARPPGASKRAWGC